jgi:uncharacterized protein
MKHFFRDWTRRFHSVRDHKHLSRFGPHLDNPNLWHINRQSITRGVTIGLFVAFLPIPFQMLLAAFIAICSSANLIVSVVLVWVTNPLTMGPIFYFAYRLGDALLPHQAVPLPTQWDWTWLAQQVGQVWHPLIIGSLICGVASAMMGNIMVRLLWRVSTARRWRRRGKLRA